MSTDNENINDDIKYLDDFGIENGEQFDSSTGVIVKKMNL